MQMNVQNNRTYARQNIARILSIQMHLKTCFAFSTFNNSANYKLKWLMRCSMATNILTIQTIVIMILITVHFNRRCHAVALFCALLRCLSTDQRAKMHKTHANMQPSRCNLLLSAIVIVFIVSCANRSEDANAFVISKWNGCFNI